MKNFKGWISIAVSAFLILHCFAALKKTTAKWYHTAAHRRLQNTLTANAVFLTGFPTPFSAVSAVDAVATGLTAQPITRFRAAVQADKSLALYADCVSAGPFLSSPVFYPNKIPKPSLPTTGYFSYITPTGTPTYTTCQKGTGCIVNVYGQGLTSTSVETNADPRDRAWLFGPVTPTAAASSAVLGVNLPDAYSLATDPCGGANSVTGGLESTFLNATTPNPDTKNMEVFTIPSSIVNTLTAGSTYVLCWVSSANFLASDSGARNTSLFKQAAQIISVQDYGPVTAPVAFATAPDRRIKCYAALDCNIGFKATFDSTIKVSGSPSTISVKFADFGTTAPANPNDVDYCNQNGLTYLTNVGAIGASSAVDFTALVPSTATATNVDTMWKFTITAATFTAMTFASDHKFLGICAKSSGSEYKKTIGWIHVFTRVFRPFPATSVTFTSGIPFTTAPFAQGVEIASEGTFAVDKARTDVSPNLAVFVCGLTSTCSLSIPTGLTGTTVPYIFLYDYFTTTKDCGESATTAIPAATAQSPYYSTSKINALNAAIGVTALSHATGILTITLDNTKFSAGRDYRLCVGGTTSPTNFADVILAAHVVFTGSTSQNTDRVAVRTGTDFTVASTAGSTTTNANPGLADVDSIDVKQGTSCTTGTPVAGVPAIFPPTGVLAASTVTAPITFSLASWITTNGALLTSGTRYLLCYQDRLTTAPPGGYTGFFFQSMGTLTYYAGPSEVKYEVPSGSSWSWSNATTWSNYHFTCTNGLPCSVSVKGYTGIFTGTSSNANFAVAKYVKGDAAVGVCRTTADRVDTFKVDTATTGAVTSVSPTDTLTLTIPTSITSRFDVGGWKYQLCYKYGNADGAAWDSSTPSSYQVVAIIHVASNTTCSLNDNLIYPAGYYGKTVAAVKTDISTFIAGSTNLGYLKGAKIKTTAATTAASSAETMKASVSVVAAVVLSSVLNLFVH